MADQVQPGQASSLMRGLDSDFTRWAENIDDVIEQFEHDLRGETYKEDEEKWVIMKGTEIMNERGINAVTRFLRAFANRNTFFSEIDEPRALRVCLLASLTFTDMLTYNLDEFGVNLNYYSVIVEEVNNILEMAIRRAIGGAEKEWLSKTESVHRIIEQHPTENKGLFGGMVK